MRPTPAFLSQECAATQHESQNSQDHDSGVVARPVRGWGRLWALSHKLAHVDLIAEEIRFGRRPSSNVVFDSRQVPSESVLKLISGDHCRIFRKAATVNLDDSMVPIFIEDMSSNGTFVNDKKMIKGEQALLKHGDRINLTRPTRKTDTGPVAYMFEDFAVTKKNLKQHENAFADRYDFDRELGVGNFSRVYLAYRKSDNTEVAVKCIDKRRFWSSPKTKEQLLREADILREVDHPNVIKVHEVVDSEQFLYLVLEYAAGGELFAIIQNRGNITENEARAIFKQMLAAVSYLHKRGIAHRDLKPENILFASAEVVKITDFGLARFVGDNIPTGTLCGTPQYVEIVLLSNAQPTSTNRGYGVAVDMWSLGVMLYVLLSGIFPFDETARAGSLFEQIEQGAYDFPMEYFNNVSTNAKSLIEALLRVNPTRRLTAEAALQHPWITQPPCAQPTVLPLVRTPSAAKAEETPDKAAKTTADTDDEGGGVKRPRREAIDEEQFSPEIVKTFRLKLPPSSTLEAKRLTFTT